MFEMVNANHDKAEIWHDGTKVGTIALVRADGNRREFVAAGVFVEEASGDIAFMTSIGSSAAVTERI